MDAVDPSVVADIERVAATVAGVEAVHDVRVRWLGHKLHADLHVTVDEEAPTQESHCIVEEVRHALFHDQPRLAVITAHAHPCGHGGSDPHAIATHHNQPGVSGSAPHRHARGTQDAY